MIRQLLLLLTSAALLTLTASPSRAAAPPEINLRHTITVDVVRKTKDAVVNISTTKMVAQRVSPWGFDPFWQQFQATSLGSGFIVHPDGYVVTNHHVIDRARQIHIELADGRKLPAQLISSDAEADLAILKIDPAPSNPKSQPKPFPSLELGDSSDLLIGEPVIAVGNPLGFSHSVSTGIVSAIHRDLRDDRDRVLLTDLIQTDAAINPGNSGGPLLNAYAQVIGINTAIRGDAQNIGFAIQVNRLRDLVPDLMAPAQVNKVDLPQLKLIEQRKLTPPATITSTIRKVGTDSPLSAINNHRPNNIIDAYAILLRVVKPNDKVILTYADGKSETLIARPSPPPRTITEAREILGITVEPVTPMLAEKYDLQTETGLHITEVARNSIAAKAGLRPGDVIIQLGRYRVSTLDDFGTLLQHLPQSGRIRIGIVRGDRVGYAWLDL